MHYLSSIQSGTYDTHIKYTVETRRLKIATHAFCHVNAKNAYVHSNVRVSVRIKADNMLTS